MNLFKLHLVIKHADWPYILQGFLSFFILSLLGYLLLKNGAFLYFLLVLTLVFLVLTAVHFHNLRKIDLQHMQYKIQAINELMQLLPLRFPLPAMTGWAATPELAINVYKMIELGKPKIVAELGSGVTTIISAYALEKFSPDGKVLSFDHNQEFAEKTKKELEQHNLEKFVDIQHASLSEINFKNQHFKWYDIDFSNIKAPIDLLIIDGPPVKTQEKARYPALPIFYSRLSKNAVIIFHDTDRESESEIVDSWLKEFTDLSHMNLNTEKGITIFRRETKD